MDQLNTVRKSFWLADLFCRLYNKFKICTGRTLCLAVTSWRHVNLMKPFWCYLIICYLYHFILLYFVIINYVIWFLGDLRVARELVTTEKSRKIKNQHKRSIKVLKRSLCFFTVHVLLGEKLRGTDARMLRQKPYFCDNCEIVDFLTKSRFSFVRLGYIYYGYTKKEVSNLWGNDALAHLG